MPRDRADRPLSAQGQTIARSMKKEPQYSLLSGLIAVLLGLAILTILPREASAPNLLGYHSLCAFVPVSTVILLGLAGFARLMRNMLYKREPRE